MVPVAKLKGGPTRTERGTDGLLGGHCRSWMSVAHTGRDLKNFHGLSGLLSTATIRLGGSRSVTFRESIGGGTRTHNALSGSGA